MHLTVGGDHAGFALKAVVVEALRSWGHGVEDAGCHTSEPVDFPDIAAAVCAEVQAGRAERGILVCGTGVGACIAANKLPGIRAALCHDIHSAHQCVEHDDANVLCLGAQIVGEWLALDLLRAYLAAEFRDEEPFRRRLAKLATLEGGGTGERVAFRLRVREERLAEYKQLHLEVWPELLADMRAAGIRDYSIFADGPDLFGSLECDDWAATTAALAVSDANRRWQALMAEYLATPVDPNTAEPLRLMEEVFRME